MRDALRIVGLTKKYGDVTALDGTSFEASPGTFVTLLGPSGCGKTTTLRLIAGFESPDQGSIWIGDQEIGRIPAHKRPVNTVFQDFALFPHMTVFDNVAFGPRLQRAPETEIRNRVGEVLALVRLTGMEQRRPHELSGGQQQRVALARALVNKPKILLLDEPLSNLDQKLRIEMRLELKRIRRKVETTFIMVTHDQEEALTLADHVVVMKAGKIQQVGTPEDLYVKPSNLFVASFIGKTNCIEGEIRERSLHVPGMANPIPISPPGPPAAGPVTLCIRSESVVIEPRGDRSGEEAVDTRVVGTVEDVLYVGDHSEVVVRLGTDTLLKCEYRSAGGRQAPFKVGEPITLGWNEAQTFVFENGSTS